jgi:GNAT superfamily N-acetyltransferase
MGIQIRDAQENDAALILGFIQNKAAFDKGMHAFEGEIQTDETRIRHTLFGPQPFARVLIAENENEPAGFALFYFRYSSFQGRASLWLDDLYVDEKQRSRGVGAALMNRLAQIAVQNRCTHMSWTASVNNTRGLRFYEKLGAQIVERKEHQLVFRWDENAMRSFVRS